MSASRQVGSRPRRAFGLPDLFWIIAVIALMIAIMLPSLSRSRELSKRAVCAANLRGISQGMHIYANENADWFPHHYYTAAKPGAPRGQEVAVDWVGTMGSNDFLKISEATSPTKSSDRNHPSRSLFMLVIQGDASPKRFICPSAGDVEDTLRNRGPDSASGGTTAALPSRNRFDFQGYHTLSYGYQLPYGLRGTPSSTMDPRAVVMADKGPYYQAAGEGLPGSGTIRDGRSMVAPPQEWQAQGAQGVLRIPNEQWRPYNSRNHRGEGQNVLHFDGFAEFVKRPLAGVNYDNIYTLQTDFDLLTSLLGTVPDAQRPLGPFTNTDTFIVP